MADKVKQQETERIARIEQEMWGDLEPGWVEDVRWLIAKLRERSADAERLRKECDQVDDDACFLQKAIHFKNEQIEQLQSAIAWCYQMAGANRAPACWTTCRTCLAE